MDLYQWNGRTEIIAKDSGEGFVLDDHDPVFFYDGRLEECSWRIGLSADYVRRVLEDFGLVPGGIDHYEPSVQKG